MSDEQIKYHGRFIKLSEHTIGKDIWEKVYLTSGVIIYPITIDGKILLIKEKRPHENPPERLKFVTGLIDDGDDPIQTANREMQEEIGLKASKLEILITRKSTGTINNHIYQIVATGLTQSKLPNPDGEDTIMEIIPYTISEIIQFLYDGRLPWDQAALGIFKMREDKILG